MGSDKETIVSGIRRAASDPRARVAAAALAVAGAAAVAVGARARHRGRGGTGQSTAYRLKPTEETAAGIRRVALGRIGRATERLEEGRGADDPARFVHGARKDLKKLRSLLRLVRHEVGEDRYRAENRSFREAGRLLSSAREAEVKVATLEGICERFDERLPPGAAGEWLEVLREERDRATEEALAGDSATLSEARQLVELGRERVRAWELEADDWDLVGPGIHRAYRRGRRRMRRAAAEPHPEAFHAWRKRVKDLWYQLRVLERAIPEKLADRLDLADRLADVLGDHHDLAVLRDDLLLRDLPTVKRVALVAAIAERQDQLAAEAFDLGERLYAEKPKRFHKRMRRGWRDWRDAG